MRRAVFDTNVVASASFWNGNPRRALEAVARERVRAVVSPALLVEYGETLDALQTRYPDREPVPWREFLGEAGELVFPSIRLRGATPDPGDEMVLECAVAGEADYLVTGDRKHLIPLVEFRGVKILTPAEFVSRLDSPGFGP